MRRSQNTEIVALILEVSGPRVRPPSQYNPALPLHSSLFPNADRIGTMMIPDPRRSNWKQIDCCDKATGGYEVWYRNGSLGKAVVQAKAMVLWSPRS